MNCPNCGATLRLEESKDRLTCDFCKYIHFPDENEDGVRVLDVASTLVCPVCAIPLGHAAISGQRVLYCNRCRGLLIAMPLFVDLIDALRARSGSTGAIPRPPAEEELERRINCPQCREPMDTHPYAGPGNVVIDNCPRCLLNWLDYPELRRITTAPDTIANFTPDSDE